MNKQQRLEGRSKSGRIVFHAPAGVRRNLEDLSGKLDLPKVGTLRFGISMLAQIVRELDKGGKLVFKNPDGTEREIIIPQLGLADEIEAAPENPEERPHTITRRKNIVLNHPSHAR